MENLNKSFIIRNKNVIGLCEKNTMTLSQEAYDALSEEKKNDGTIYFILDGDGEIGIQDTIISENSVWSSQKVSDKVAEVESKVDGLLDNSSTSETSTWSSSKIASEISAKGTKTQYRGSQSIDIATSGKLTFIFSSMYASQAGCYMLLSNYNTTPLLIELGRNNIGQFKVTATNKSFGVDTITVTTGAPEYSWYVLQF